MRRLPSNTPFKYYYHNMTLSFHKNSSLAHMSTTTTTALHPRQKVIVIMGPTGCGKSKLSVEQASRFHGEIINSDKIQLHQSLPITTNKIPLHERRNIPHHLLGACPPTPGFTPYQYRSAASSAISNILRRRKIPFLVGGSNSYIYALLAKDYRPDDHHSDTFTDPDPIFCKELRYNCCFLWVDVALPVLNQYLDRRVDDMVDAGMLEELAEYFGDPVSGSGSKYGLDKAIGVPEYEKYLRNNNKYYDDQVMMIRVIKENTRQLAERQLGKILRLRDHARWDLNRLDATSAFKAAIDGNKKVEDVVWEREVVETSVNIVKRFLIHGHGHGHGV